jgi:uncharacterized protein
MLTDTLTPVSWRARPRSFVALMGLYESNYIRLGWLVGDLARISGEHCSRAHPDCELLLSVTERSPYTTTLKLTYLLPPGGAQSIAPMLRIPDMRVRVYHDAHLVEALDCGAGHRDRLARQATPRERELQQRWSRNMLLNKWLEYCVERGHRFGRTLT